MFKVLQKTGREKLVYIGHSMVIPFVHIRRSRFDASVNFNMIGGYLATGSAVLKLNWTQHQYSIVVDASMLDGIFKFYGGIKIESDNSIYILVDASINLPKSLPWPIGGLKLAEAGLYFQYIPYAPKSDDFGAGWIHLWLIGTVGVQVDFNGHFDLIGKKTVAKYKVTFAAQDGPIAGGVVFLDLNKNGVWDDGEPTTITAFDGSYSLPGNMGGQLVLVGGTDISTNLPNTAVLTAPAAATMISPYTTLVNYLMTEQGLTEPNAEAELCDTLGIPATITVTSTDIIKLAQMGDVGAAQAFATEIKLANLTTMAAAALGTGQPVSQYTSHIYSSLASWIAANPGSPVDLSDPAIVGTILADAATHQGVILDLDKTATLIAAVNQQINAIHDHDSNFLESVVRVQVVAQGTVAPLLLQVANGSTTIDLVLAAETTELLTLQVGAAQIGELQAPVISTNNVAQLAGPADTTYTFNVSRDSTVSPLLPVSVDYSTVDGTATAGVDYTATNGTLTWAPGETGPKTIVVPVAGSTLNQSAKTFGIFLSNPQSAVLAVENQYGVGTIVYNSNPATSTTLTTSTAAAQSGESVTLTATVTDSEGHPAPQGSTVTFYDGSTELGVAFVGPDGTAEGNTTDLSLGTRHLTAVYSAVTDPIGTSLVGASTSTEVIVQVGKLNQTIDFPTPKNGTYGSDSLRPAPVLLQAVSTSGLAVSYRVVSGPATVADNLLTFTGLGKIVVEATQVGDDSTNPATPVSQTFSVAPAPLTFTVYDLSIRYGDPIPQVDSAFSGFVNGDTADSLTVAPTISILDADDKPVSGTPAPGTYTIVANGAVDPNYDVTYVPATLTVSRAPLTITALEQSMVYGSSTPELTFTCTGLLDSDTPSVVSGLTLATDTGTAATVGTHAITVGGGAAANYDITYVPATLTVTPAPLTITPNNQTIVYGAALPTLTASYTGLVNGDTAASLTTPPTIRIINAYGTQVTGTPGPGTYAIVVSGAVDFNYDITYVSASLTVNRAPLTITANSRSMVYGCSTPELTFTSTGFLAGDSPSVVSGLTLATDTGVAATVGTHAITVGDGVAANYDITYVPGTLTVTLAPLTITTSNQTIVYGEELPTLTAGYTGLVNGDTVASLTTAPTIRVLNAASTPVSGIPASGTYRIELSNAVDANYDITYVSATLTVTPAPLTITADNQTAIYGATLPTLTASYAGLVNGDTAAPTIRILDADGKVVSGIPASGTYTIVASGDVDSNYDITYVPATLTITPAPLTITANNQTIAYSAALSILTAGYTGLVNGDTAASLTTAPAISILNAAGTPVSGTPTPGTYTISTTGAVDTNYTISYGVATLTVSRATPALILSSAPASITYNGKSDVTSWATATLSGASGASAPTSPVTLSFYNGSSTTGTALTSLPVNAGTYTVMASYGGDGNYTAIASPAVTFTINRAAAQVQLALPPSTITCDGSNDVTAWVKATLAGPLNAPAPSGSLTYTYYSGTTATGTPLTSTPSAAGTYTVVASYGGNSNYLPSSASTTFTINAAVALTTSTLVNGLPNTGSIVNTQRSQVTGMVINFSAPVTLSAGAITLADQDSANPFGGAGARVPFTLTSSNGGATYTLTFSGAGFVSRGSLATSLPNGHYVLAVNFSLVSCGTATVPSGSQSLLFHRLYGDLTNAGYITTAAARTASSAANWSTYWQYLNNDGAAFSAGYNGNDAASLAAAQSFVTGTQAQALWKIYNS